MYSWKGYVSLEVRAFRFRNGSNTLGPKAECVEPYEFGVAIDVRGEYLLF